ncbi:hypothetical protein SCOR_28900 [Sulfidibacter corallicola]|uniref:Uncharacterized protein n=1 Tax=Sulfidibacter corallicola TaxID=2818388 RepID=A0A8A4TMI6_SULCO|nr:hypothetical protein [Sulfidibacter corallicola]QTD50424.1 hypothetical protein J3U87_32985 [Sulfidibacter corallicola]
MKQPGPATDSYCQSPQRDRHNKFRLNGWGLAWVASWLLSLYGIKFQWLSSSALAITAIAVTTALGIAMMFAYRRYLRETDELRRKIELDALALAVGVALVGSVAYSLLVRAGIMLETGISVFVILIAATYVAGVLLGYRRYA